MALKLNDEKRAHLWWLGQMGLMVQIGNTKICIDYFASPFEARQVAPPVPTDELTGIDAFLGTHDHLDHIDLQLIPINGRDAKRYSENCIGNMTYQEAADLAGETGSSFVIPGHWDMFADNSEDPMKFADYISVKYPYGPKCILPKVMEEIAL